MNGEMTRRKKTDYIRVRMEEPLRVRFKWACARIDEDISNVVRDLMRSAVDYIDEYCAPQHRWITPELRPIAARKKKTPASEVATNHVHVEENHGRVTVHAGSKGRNRRR